MTYLCTDLGFFTAFGDENEKGTGCKSRTLPDAVSVLIF